MADFEDWGAKYVSDADPLGETRWDPYETTQYPNRIKAYKANYKTGELETLPMTWDQYSDEAIPFGRHLGVTPFTSSPYANIPTPTGRPLGPPARDTFKAMAGGLHALYASQQYGGPKVSPEDMAALLNQEGRMDFGINGDANSYSHDKKAFALYNKLTDAGFSPDAANVPATILAAQNTGKRLNTPWTRIWNGTGEVPVFSHAAGDSAATHTHGGNEYASEFEKQKAAASNPKNADFLNFIRQNMAAPQDLDAINQAEYQRRLAARNAYVNDRTAERVKGGTEATGIDDRVAHGVGALLHGQNPFASWSPEELDAYYRKGAEKDIPAVRPYTAKKKSVKVAANAAGGTIIDDGNPAKRRKLI